MPIFIQFLPPAVVSDSTSNTVSKRPHDGPTPLSSPSKARPPKRSRPSLASMTEEELAAIEEEINELGGLETYQKMSVIGQGNDRGGGSEKVLIAWLNELDYPECLGQSKMRYVRLSLTV